MQWSRALPIGTALEGGEEEELDAGGVWGTEANSLEGEGVKTCSIFYLECLVFISWLMGAFDFPESQKDTSNFILRFCYRYDTL